MSYARNIGRVFVTLSAAAMLMAAYPVAGTGARGIQDGCMSQSRFNAPGGLLANEDGTLTVFDTFNHSVREISQGDTQTLVEREGYLDSFGMFYGFLIDGYLDTARLNRPTDGVRNAYGYLFITDSANHVIRVIRNNRMYTFVGQQTPGHNDGSHNAAQFNTPQAIAIDDYGNLFVADTLNNTIRKVTPYGQVSTIAGVAGVEGYRNGAANHSLFNAPSGIAVNADGTVIYVADTGNHIIRKIEDGNVTTLAGTYGPLGGFYDGAAEYAMFSLPHGIAIFEDYVIIADSGNHMIRAISPDGLVFTLAGDGEPGDLNSPTGISIFENTLYIADTGNNQIKSIVLGE